ncbi:Cytochrome P450 9c1 [Gryllus bimaculatus]|nr:Cytochrome P450 9c1 [Gryllus bimaculatus]
MFKLPFLWIRDPEIIKRVLVKDFAHFHDRGMAMDEEKNPLSANLFNLPGARWRALRTKLTPTFTSGKMKMMFELMHECAREFVDFVSFEADANGEVEFKEVFAKLTTDIIGSCAFGLQFNSMKNPDSEFRKMGRKIFTPDASAVMITILQFMLPAIGKFFSMRLPTKEVSDFFMKAVLDTVEYREKNNVKRNDFLQLLIELKNKGKIEDEEHETKPFSQGVTLENGEVKEIDK